MSDVGSISKYHIIQDLEKTFATEPQRRFRVLDVGVTGPFPMQFWQPLFKHPNFELDGIDIDGPSIEALKKKTLPPQVKRLEALSGYDLLKKFEPASFDIVVSTQVLEHMKHPERCLAAVAAVLKRLMDDLALRTSLASAAREDARNYDWDAIAARMGNLFSRIT